MPRGAVATGPPVFGATAADQRALAGMRVTTAAVLVAARPGRMTRR